MRQGRSALIRGEGLCKAFQQGGARVEAVRQADLTVWPGDFIAITGPSGSGKTTLLQLIGCILRPDSGRLWLGDQEAAQASEKARAAIRRRQVGFVFQDYRLLPALTVRENLLFPLRLAGEREEAGLLEETAAALGLEGCLDAFPGQLSGGQRQRAAIARAILRRPQALLADEPTGSLDSRGAQEILRIFHWLNQCGTAILLVTHDPAVARACPAAWRMLDGRLAASPQGARG